MVPMHREFDSALKRNDQSDVRFLSPSNVRSYTPIAWTALPPKHELNKDNNNNNNNKKVDEGKPMRPQRYTKNHRQLRNCESGRNSLLWGRAHRLVI